MHRQALAGAGARDAAQVAAGLVEAHQRMHLRDGVERGVGGDVERRGARALRAHLHQRAQQRPRPPAHHGAAAFDRSRGGLCRDRVPRRPGHEAMHAVGDVGAAERGAADVGDVGAHAAGRPRSCRRTGCARPAAAPRRRGPRGRPGSRRPAPCRRRPARPRSRSARTCRPPSRPSRAPARRRPGAPRSCAAAPCGAPPGAASAAASSGDGATSTSVNAVADLNTRWATSSAVP